MVDEPLRVSNFDIDIGDGQGRDYPVTARTPAGEAQETLHFPFDQLALENAELQLKLALRQSHHVARRILSPEIQAVQDFGAALFDALFTGEIRNRYDLSRERVLQTGEYLRIRLRITAPELAALPWEFLYDPRTDNYLSLSSHTPIVRYLELPHPPRAIKITPPLRILGLTCSPANLPPLDLAQEQRRIETALEPLMERGFIELHWAKRHTWRDLQRALRQETWHVFHFIGHGGFDRGRDEGFVVLEESDHTAQYLYATQLGRMLADHTTLRLAFLNACEGGTAGDLDVFSSTAAILARQGLPAVLAMQYSLSDQAAIEIAATFYEALTDNYPADVALSDARKAVEISLPQTVEWGIPILHLRTPDGYLFTLPPTSLSGFASSHGPRHSPSRSEALHKPERAETLRAKVSTLALLLKGESFITIANHGAPVNSVAFSPRGDIAATAGDDNKIRIWDLANGTLAQILRGHTAPVSHVAFHPDGNVLASGSQDATVRLWNADQGKLLSTFSAGDGVKAVAFSPRGHILGAGNCEHTLYLWDTHRATILRLLRGHTSPVNALAFSPEEDRLASGAADGVLRLWELAGGQFVETLKHSHALSSIAFSRDAGLLAAGSVDGALLICHRMVHASQALTAQGVQFNLTAWSIYAPKKTFRSTLESIRWLAFGQRDTLLIAGGDAPQIQVLDVTLGKILRRLSGITSGVRGGALSADGRHLLAAASDGALCAWDLGR